MIRTREEAYRAACAMNLIARRLAIINAVRAAHDAGATVDQMLAIVADVEENSVSISEIVRGLLGDNVVTLPHHSNKAQG